MNNVSYVCQLETDDSRTSVFHSRTSHVSHVRYIFLTYVRWLDTYISRHCASSRQNRKTLTRFAPIYFLHPFLQNSSKSRPKPVRNHSTTFHNLFQRLNHAKTPSNPQKSVRPNFFKLLKFVRISAFDLQWYLEGK